MATETVILTSNTSWTVPYTWNNSNNSVTCIGGGAGGRSSSGDAGGGGGAARVKNTNVSLTAGASVSYAIGAGGAAGVAGGDTTFNSSAMVAKGGSGTANSTGGAGGSAASSTGTTKFSGGNGGNGASDAGGGGGGAAGDTANGSNGASRTLSETGGNGGNGGATDGGNGGAGGVSTSGIKGYNGFSDGSTSTTFSGTNYAGGGGGGGGSATDKAGTTYYNGGDGGLFGGGGGGGSLTGGGVGSQGAIILQWTWTSTLQSSGAISVSDINTVLQDSSSNTTSLNDADARGVANVASGQISMSNFYGKNEEPTYVAASQGTGAITLPTGWAVGDLAILTLARIGSAFITSGGWTLIDNVKFNTSGGDLNIYYRILQSGDTGPSVSNGENWQMIAFRGASKATSKAKTENEGSTTLTFSSGITKSSDSKLLVSIVGDRRNISNPTVPTGWTARAYSVGAGTTAATIIESASLRSTSYTNGSSVQWTGFETTYSQGGIIIELE